MIPHSKETSSNTARCTQSSKMRQRATLGFAVVMNIVRLLPMLSPGLAEFQDNAWLLELPIFLITITYLSIPLLHNSEAVLSPRRVLLVMLGALKNAIGRFSPVASVVAVAETVVPIATVPLLPLLRFLGGGTDRRLLFSAVQNKLSCCFIGYYLVIASLWRSNATPFWRSSLYLLFLKLIIDRYLDYCRYTTERSDYYGQLQGEHPRSPDVDSDDEVEVVAIGQDDIIAERGAVNRVNNRRGERNTQLPKLDSPGGPINDGEGFHLHSLCGNDDDDSDNDNDTDTDTDNNNDDEKEGKAQEQLKTCPSDCRLDKKKHPEPGASSVHAAAGDGEDDELPNPKPFGGQAKEKDQHHRLSSLNGRIKVEEEAKDTGLCSSLVNACVGDVENILGDEEEKWRHPRPSSSRSQVNFEGKLASIEYEDFLTLSMAIQRFPLRSCLLTTAQCVALYILPSYIDPSTTHWFIEQALQGGLIMALWVVAALATIACNLPGFGIGASLFLVKAIRTAKLGNDARLAAQAAVLLADAVSTVIAVLSAPPARPVSLFDIIWKNHRLRTRNIIRILLFGSLVVTTFSLGLIVVSRILCEPRYLGSGFPPCRPI